MPRSTFSENPLLRVSRPVSACSRCRAAKVKCDGKLPACTACEKAGRENECSAANDQFARGKERSYVTALELRVEKLERGLSFAESRKASVALHDPEALPVQQADRKDSLAAIRTAVYRKAARKRENSDVNSLVSDFGFLSVNATTRDFEPSLSNMTFAQLVLAAATNDPLPEPQMVEPPSRQTALALAQHYLDNIYAVYPFFPTVTLHSIIEAIYDENGVMRMGAAVRPADCWLLYMAMAIGSTAQSRTCQDGFYRDGVEYVTQAMRYAKRALSPGHDTQIRSLLVLTQYSMFDPAHFDSWHLIGFTCRAIIDLGLHQDPPESQPMSDKEKLNMRRKLFWSAYALDRSISMVHARAFSFTDDAINVSLPSMTGLGRIPSTTGPITGPQSADPAILLFQLRQTQSHWYQTLFQSDPSDPLQDPPSYIWQMCHEMREWSESLPDTLPRAVRQMFELELKYSYVYCIAPSGRAPDITPYGRVLIFEHAIAYTDAVYGLVHNDQLHDASSGAPPPPPSALMTYHQALRVYFMGSQFVAVMRDTGDALLAGSSFPMPIPQPGKAPPPPIPERWAGSGDNLDRSLACLEKVSATLKTLGERWDNANALRSTFDMISAETLDELRSRKAARDQAQAAGQAPSPEQQQQLQQSQSPQQQAMSGPVSTPPGQGTMSAPIPPQMRMSPPMHQQQQPQPPPQSSPFHMRPQNMGPPPPPGQGGPSPNGHYQGMMGPMHPQQQQHQLPMPPPPQQQQQPNQDGVNWVGVDLQQIMRQGGI